MSTRITQTQIETGDIYLSALMLNIGHVVAVGANAKLVATPVSGDTLALLNSATPDNTPDTIPLRSSVGRLHDPEFQGQTLFWGNVAFRGDTPQVLDFTADGEVHSAQFTWDNLGLSLVVDGVVVFRFQDSFGVLFESININSNGQIILDSPIDDLIEAYNFKIKKDPVDGYVATSDADGNVSWAPKPITGSHDISNGASNGSVSYSIPFTPSAVMVVVRKPSGGLTLFASVVDGTIADTGFDFDLSGATDSANYDLDYVLFP